MATSKLKTDWVCIAKSGATIDGRTINPDHLRAMAFSYDPAVYTALIWPDHDRWFSPNFGRVDSVKLVENEDGSVSLWAILAPNENYLFANRNGQYLFTSVEMMFNFPDAGNVYMGGLGCTDSPASAATSEIRFSADDSVSVLFNQSVELNLSGVTEKPSKPSLFRRLFNGETTNPEEPEMDKDTKAAVLAALNTLGEKFEAFAAKFDQNAAAVAAAAEQIKPADPDKFAALEQEIADLKAKLAEASAKPASVSAEEFATLKKDLTDLTAAFKKAVGEEHPDGTKPGEQTGDAEDLAAYI